MAARWLLLAGLCVGGWVLGATDPPPAPPPLPCTLVEQGGAGGLSGSLRQRPAQLWLRGGPETPPDPSAGPDVTFTVTDPWDALSCVWGPPWTSPPPKCELSPTVPVTTPPGWAPGLDPAARSPPGLGGPWWVATLGTPRCGVTALLQGGVQPHPHPPGAATAVTVPLAVFTLTPSPGGSLGSPLALHCAFAAPPGPFALEWRHQARGAGRRLLAYDSGTGRVTGAAPGVRLLLGPPPSSAEVGGSREVSLQLEALGVSHRGTFVCSVFLAHSQAQQLLRLRVLEPPKVRLRPAALAVAPGARGQLLCEASGFFPLDVEFEWRRRAGPGGPDLPLGDTVTQRWSSGQRRAADGTFSRSSTLSLGPAQRSHHGDLYTCLVTHPALARPRSASARLEVQGAAGPGLEDAVGLFLAAFALCALCRWRRPAPRCSKEEPKKSQ